VRVGGVGATVVTDAGAGVGEAPAEIGGGDAGRDELWDFCDF
jgi:hypothetical protein